MRRDDLNLLHAAAAPPPARTGAKRPPAAGARAAQRRLDGVAEPLRVRFAHLSDQHICTLADAYAIDGDDTVRPLSIEGGEAA